MVGVLMLESGLDTDTSPVRVAFVSAGLLLAVDLCRVRRGLSARTARVGAVLTAITALAVGLGFGFGSFVGFIAAYTGVLFLFATAAVWTLPLPLRSISAARGSSALRSGFAALVREQDPLRRCPGAAADVLFHCRSHQDGVRHELLHPAEHEGVTLVARR